MEREKKLFIIKWMALAAFVLTAFRYVNNTIAMNQNAAKIPIAARGSYVVFHNELNRSAQITQVDVTEEYIYFAYSTDDVVAVYDWDGNYQYSFAFAGDTNGGMSIRCEDELLYVQDRVHNEYIFQGETLVKEYDAVESTYSYGWHQETRDISIRYDNYKVYDLEGNYIMDLPGHLPGQGVEF